MRIFLKTFSTEAFLLIVVGVFIWLANLGIFVFNFRRDWPVILIFIGLVELLNGLFRRRKHLFKFGGKENLNQEIVKEEINNVLSDLSSGKINSDEASDKIKDIKEKYQD